MGTSWLKQHSWSQAEPGFPRTLDCWALEGPLVLLGYLFSGPIWGRYERRGTGLGPDLFTWHASSFIRKVRLSMQILQYFGGRVCTRWNSLQDFENVSLPKHKS